MDILSFIVQRFFWGLGAGCMINLFFISNYFILVNKIYLPNDLLFIKNLANISGGMFIFLFILGTVIVGIFIGGVFEIGWRYFLNNHNSMFKKGINSRDNEYKNFNFIGRLLYFLFQEVTTCDISTNIEKEESKKKTSADKKENEQNSLYDFMCNPNNIGDASMIMQTWAKIIAREEKSNGVYAYRDMSFIIQLMRSSFLIIFIISLILFLSVFMSIEGKNNYHYSYLAAFLLSIIFFFVTTPILVPFKERKRLRCIFAIFLFMGVFAFLLFIVFVNCKEIKIFLLWWYLMNFFISMIAFLITGPMAIRFGKRYICDIGISYNAMQIKSKRDIKK